MFECVGASIASLGKLSIVTVGAVEAVVLGNELLIGQRPLTTPAEETTLMPMSSFV